MTKKTLFTLLLVAIAYVLVQVFLRPMLRASPLINQLTSLIYAWIPGVIALIAARKEGISLPIFAKPNRTFWSIPLVTFGICLFAFLVSIPFGMTNHPNPAFEGKSLGSIIGYAVLFFLTTYVVLTIFLGIIILVGELFWRGYLWEKWKKEGRYRAVWLIAIAWSLYGIPLTILAYSPGLPNWVLNILWGVLLNFVLTPILLYFRIKGKSILSSAFFFSSLIGSCLYFLVLFPVVQLRVMAIYAVFTIVGIVLYSLFKRLYFSSSWKKLL